MLPVVPAATVAAAWPIDAPLPLTNSIWREPPLQFESIPLTVTWSITAVLPEPVCVEENESDPVLQWPTSTPFAWMGRLLVPMLVAVAATTENAVMAATATARNRNSLILVSVHGSGGQTPW